MFKKNIPFLLLAAYLTIPICQADITQGMRTKQWSEEIKKLEKEKQALTQKKIPRLKGLLVFERTELLATSKEVKLLIIEVKKFLAESKLALADTGQDLAKLIRALTYLVYIISAVICIFGIAYTVQKIR